MLCLEATLAFRTHKMYDSAIRLEMTCRSLVMSPFDSKISLALTYLEQYRLVFHQKSQIRKEVFSTMNSLITSMMEEHQLRSFGSPEYMLVLAQWYYLTHPLAVDKSEKEESRGIKREIPSSGPRPGSGMDQSKKMKFG